MSETDASGPLAPQALDAESVVARARFDDRGLLPAVIQQFDTLEVLMLGYMDAEALRRTYTTGRVTFWSRSRQEYWRKGDTSGHAQFVKTAALDCDGDTLLVSVDQVGVACHTGTRTCFDGDPLAPVVGAATGDGTADGSSAAGDGTADGRSAAGEGTADGRNSDG